MIVVALVPLIIGGIVAIVAPRLARRMPPAAAAVVLTGLALSVALAVGALLCLAAIIGFKLAFPALRPTDWSTTVVRDVIPLPPVVGIAAGVVAAALLLCSAAHAVRVGVRLRQASQAARALPTVDGLATLEDDRAQAYAVPGRPGRIVVSSGLLRLLTAPQRDAVIAHERSHLRHRHYVYAQLVRLAASANPLLRRLVPAVDVALERWADADAARAVGSPRVVAHAIGAVALAAVGVSLNAGGQAVVERARVLLAPPARRSHATVVVTALVTVLVWVATVWAAVHVHGLIEAAEAAYLSTRT